MKVAIIGAGAIGAVHADAYRELEANLVAVVEPVEEAALQFAQKYSVTPYRTLSELLGSPDRPGAISICTPPFTHRELVEQAIAAEVHILCEKPMAHTLEDAEAIYAAAANAKTLFATAYCHRFQPEIERIQALIAEGKVGTVRTFYNSFSGNQDGIEKRWFGRKKLSGGGVIIDTAIHSIDIFRYLCGEIAAASGTMTTWLGSTDLGVEHTATVGLRAENGVIGTIDCSWKTPNDSAVVRISGSEGTLSFDYYDAAKITFQPVVGTTKVIQVAGANRFIRELAAFIEAADSGREARTGAFDGLVGLAVVSAVYRNTSTILFTPPAKVSAGQRPSSMA
jgi:predicted dehydrogenase